MSDRIPPELIRKILCRLPLHRILHFRLVCKSWCRLIDDPHFAKLHHAYKFNDDVGYLIVKHHDEKVSLLSLDFSKKFDTAKINIPCSLKYIASCNGLILLSQGENKELLSIVNPLTKELQRLPITPTNVHFFDFGYDIVSDDYKVLASLSIFTPISERRITIRKYSCHIWVYSLKLNSWKQLDHIPCRITVKGEKGGKGVMVNGALHWTAIYFGPEQHRAHSLQILAIDLETESCRFYNRPNSQVRLNEYILLEVDGCLCFSVYDCCGKCLEVWSMTEYGNENSWTKLFSIKAILFEVNDRFDRLIGAKIVSYSKSKRSFLIKEAFRNDDGNLNIKNKFCWFNLDTNIFENIYYGEINMSVLSSQVFIPTLDRIKGNDEIEEHASNRKRKREHASIRG